MDINSITDELKKGSEKLALQNACQKNLALQAVAEAINKNRQKILSANKIDIENAKKEGIKESLIDRLSLDEKRIDSILESMKIVISQTDPIGEEIAGWKTPNGLTIRQVRVPLGVVAIIYESRPNVTVDAFCLAYKSGNSILLRGSSSAYNSNKAIVEIIKAALKECEYGVEQAIELVKTEKHSHEDVNQILNAVGKIDVVLPRGGKNLIKTVVSNARIPVIETGSGVCHLFVDESANLEMAAKIAENAKIQRPSVCNSIECILIHKNIAQEFLPILQKQFAQRVTFHADELCYSILEKNGCKNLVSATENDFGFEFLDYECTLKIVEDISQAIEYINTHNTKHSESIITEDRRNAALFQAKIDAACVYVNSSTRFTDGGEFGFGAELGISTQKLHARGPMGIKALTTTKYLIDGDGQIR
mgnify:CR=1 FL=1